MDELLERAANADHTAYEASFRKLMDRSIERVNRHMQRKRGWKPVANNTPELQIYVSERKGVVIRVEALLKGEARHLFHMQMDNDWASRSRWDSAYFESLQEIGKYDCDEGALYVVECVMRVPFPLRKRYMSGIQYGTRMGSAEEWCIVFRSAEHCMAECPVDMKRMGCLSALYIQQLRRGRVRCIVLFDELQGVLNMTLMNIFAGHLRERFNLYQRVMDNFASYYQLHDDDEEEKKSPRSVRKQLLIEAERVAPILAKDAPLATQLMNRK